MAVATATAMAMAIGMAMAMAMAMLTVATAGGLIYGASFCWDSGLLARVSPLFRCGLKLWCCVFFLFSS